METQVKSPHAIFNMPQRLLVPLFQRPYVWSLESQWEPLWRDIERVADRLLSPSTMSHQPHFLGAVVLQQMPTPIGAFQVRTIIDGQQRLTTLQVMLDAFHAEMLIAGATRPAARLLKLVENEEEYCETPEDRFKVWPTNRDRPAFEEVMAASTPIEYRSLEFKDERLQLAHQFFAQQASEWLRGDGLEAVGGRAEALEKTVRELLQLVVIDLDTDENAQEIFETLNSRGAQLSAADLIKNFVFQKLLEEGVNTESAYEKYWKHFETAFWEEEDYLGRLRYPRASMFLNSFLVSRLGEPIVAQEVFPQFKNYANHVCGVSMAELLEQIYRSSIVYENFLKSATNSDSDITRLALFSYRMNALDIDVVRAVVLVLLDPEQPPLEDLQLTKSIETLESFFVRRMLVRVTAKSHSRFLAQVCAELRKGDREQAGDFLEKFFASQTSESTYWPDDEEVERELSTLPVYRRLRRLRLRFVLEALEDQRRGFTTMGPSPMAEQRCPRGTLSIEHVMPRKWETNWPLQPGETEQTRKQLVDTLGNLTLLTGKLNSANSNNPWLGEKSKREALKEHSRLRLSEDLIETGAEGWTAKDIEIRTALLVGNIRAIWPVPQGHRVNSTPLTTQNQTTTYVYLSTLINAEFITAGDRLIPVRKYLSDRYATVLSDGSIELDTGEKHLYPSVAAVALSGTQAEPGWQFWVQERSGKSLYDLRSEYRDLFDETDIEIDDPTESN
jgi:hypothetical protein